MRKNRVENQRSEFSILALDDDKLMTDTIQSYFQTAGFRVDTENDPTKAAERIRTQKYDILLLDFLMRPICGDEVVRQIREFDQDIFIILLTGHKSMAPPIRTIRELDIQGYFEKNERFDQLELLIESCVKSIRMMRTIRSYRDGLRSILDHIPVLNSQSGIHEILSVLLEQIADLFHCQDACVYLDLSSLHEDDTLLRENDVVPFQGIGRLADGEETARERLRLLREKGPQPIMEESGRLLIAPLTAEGRRMFAVLIAQPSDSMGSELIPLFEIYCKQVGSIIGNSLLRSLLQIQNNRLSDAYAAMRQNYVETVDAMRKMVDAKDFYTRGHSDRVSFYAVKIAEAMHKSPETIERLRVAGLFHDIGKIGIPDGILLKNGPLTRDEYDQIKQHPVLGCDILSSISSFRDILSIVKHHHERMDGAGYPDGLAGGQIPEEARIITVADAFDAMTSKRTYRDGLTPEQALQELERGKNAQFDAAVVDVFVPLACHFDELQEQMQQLFPRSS